MNQLVQGPRGGRDAVDALIDLLSPWDLLYLRDKVRRVKIDPAAHFATCADLPPEIICQITQHLDPRDVLAVRLVSRQWKSLWMDGPVLSHICHGLFPGLIKRCHEAHESLESVYLNTLRLYSGKRPEKCATAAIPWDLDGALSNLPLDGESALDLSGDLVGLGMKFNGPHSMFSDGKLFWQPDIWQLAIDDLRTGRRVRIRGAEDPRKVNMTKHLVAASGSIAVMMAMPLSAVPVRATESCRHLNICHVKRKAWKTVTLPSGLSKCYTSSETVVATCHGGQVIAWSWDGPAEELPTDQSPLAEESSRLKRLSDGIPGVLIHPHNPRVIYLVWVYGEDQGNLNKRIVAHPTCTAVVVRYENAQDGGWTPTARFKHPVEFPDLDPARYGSYSLICERVDSNGSFSIGTCQAQIPSDFKPGRFPMSKPWWEYRNGLTQCFNVVDEVFFDISYPGCSGMAGTGPSGAVSRKPGFFDSEVLDTTRLWNRQFFQLLTKEGTSSMTWSYNDDGRAISAESPTVQSVMATSSATSWDAAVEGPGQTFADDGNQVTQIGPYQLFVDDDFMVVASRNGYSVRCFRGESTTGWIYTPRRPVQFRLV